MPSELLKDMIGGGSRSELSYGRHTRWLARRNPISLEPPWKTATSEIIIIIHIIFMHQSLLFSWICLSCPQLSRPSSPSQHMPYT
jgi:hypothetical protein